MYSVSDLVLRSAPPSYNRPSLQPQKTSSSSIIATKRDRGPAPPIIMRPPRDSFTTCPYGMVMQVMEYAPTDSSLLYTLTDTDDPTHPKSAAEGDSAVGNGILEDDFIMNNVLKSFEDLQKQTPAAADQAADSLVLNITSRMVGEQPTQPPQETILTPEPDQRPGSLVQNITKMDGQPFVTCPYDIVKNTESCPTDSSLLYSEEEDDDIIILNNVLKSFENLQRVYAEGDPYQIANSRACQVAQVVESSSWVSPTHADRICHPQTLYHTTHAESSHDSEQGDEMPLGGLRGGEDHDYRRTHTLDEPEGAGERSPTSVAVDHGELPTTWAPVDPSNVDQVFQKPLVVNAQEVERAVVEVVPSRWIPEEKPEVAVPKNAPMRLWCKLLLCIIPTIIIVVIVVAVALAF